MADKKEKDLRTIYKEDIIPAGIASSDNNGSEIIDIINDFPWTAQKIGTTEISTASVSFTHNIPFCYAIERQQTVGSNISSLINTLYASMSSIGGSLMRVMTNATGANVVDMLQNYNTKGDAKKGEANKAKEEKEKKESLSSASSSSSTIGPQALKYAALGYGGANMVDYFANSSSSSSTSSETQKSKSESPQPTPNAPEKETSQTATQNDVKTTGTTNSATVNQLKNTLANAQSLAQLIHSDNTFVQKLLQSGNLAGSKYLNPWQWLYFTQETGKKYIFPTFTANDLLKFNSSWDENAPEVAKKVTDFIQQIGEIGKYIADFTDLIPAYSGHTTTFEGYKIELAKSYLYNADNTPELDSRFILFNTVQKDIWKKNYRFLMMFLLRNMPLRVTTYSFEQPLLYDIIVPGIKHLPLCYVASLDITADGHVRTMKTDNIYSDIVDERLNDILVPVPEAWTVLIKFKCLLPDTANLMLDTLTYPINIDNAILTDKEATWQSDTAVKDEYFEAKFNNNRYNDRLA